MFYLFQEQFDQYVFPVTLAQQSSTCDRKVACRVLVGKPERQRPLEAPRRRWENNIQMDFYKLVWWAWKYLSGSGQEQMGDSC
jgi:hypothetical protein